MEAKLQKNKLTKSYINHERSVYALGYISLGIVGILGLMALYPMVGEETSAATSTDVSVSNESTVTVKLDSSVEMGTAVTDASGKFTSGVANLNVATNSPKGYDIFMTSANAGQTTLKDVNTSNTKTISSITTNTVGNNMTGNTWGYTIDTGAVLETSTFNAIPADSSSPIKTATAATSSAGDSYQLGFGAHVGLDLPAGTYTNSMIVSVIAKPLPVTITSITEMQKISTEACTNTSVGTSTVLTDTRDNKKYYVAKLADGNCWMTQNLALDLSTGKALTSADSDVNNEWTPSASTLTSTGTNVWNTNDYTAVQSMRGGHIDGSHSIESDNYGNYYSWNAPTAGTGGTMTSGEEASGSICPKGWRLPSRTEYDAFISAYGAGSNSSIMTGALLYFSRAGYINNNSGSLSANINYGVYWASTSTSYDSTAYYLLIGSNYVKTSPNNFAGGRYNGYSVRCIAR